MHDTRVVLKDGRVLEGSMWEWRPRDGYFIMMATDDRIYLRDCISVVTKEQRVHPGIVEDRDELKRAREDGWDGK